MSAPRPLSSFNYILIWLFVSFDVDNWRLEVIMRVEAETDDQDACDTINSCMTPSNVVFQLLSHVRLFATL